MRAGPMSQLYYSQINWITRERLDKENSDYLLDVDFDQYLEYLIADARWEPLQWDDTQMTVEFLSTKRQRQDRLRPTIPNIAHLLLGSRQGVAGAVSALLESAPRALFEVGDCFVIRSRLAEFLL